MFNIFCCVGFDSLFFVKTVEKHPRFYTKIFRFLNIKKARKYELFEVCIYFIAQVWQGQKDSNPRHAVLETAALPAELYPYLACGTPVRRSTILVGLQGFEPGTGRL